MGQPFFLIPFRSPTVPDLTISGNVLRQNNLLSIHYALSGSLADIFIPVLSMSPTRKDELWKTTCFEFFLAVKDLPQYWEFNISPSGDWNAYHMDAYRRIGFSEETRIQRLQFGREKDTNGFVLEAAIDLDPIIPVEAILEIGVSAIIQTRERLETSWALAHPAPEADFHLREGFIIKA